MKSLVVYYSFSGNNKMLAENMAEKLSVDIEEIVEVRKRSLFTFIMEMLLRKVPKIKAVQKPVQEYDIVILIAPIWGMKIASPLKSYIYSFAEEIKSYAFITISGGALGPNKNIMDDLQFLMEKEPIAFQELLIADLLPEEEKRNPRKTSAYKINEDDLNKKFKKELNNFISIIKNYSNKNY